jgi:hypothetical protein
MGSCRRFAVVLIAVSFFLFIGSFGFASDWLTTWDALVVSGDENFWGSYSEQPGRNIRVIVLAADTIAEGTKVRVTFKGHAWKVGEITGCDLANFS